MWLTNHRHLRRTLAPTAPSSMPSVPIPSVSSLAAAAAAVVDEQRGEQEKLTEPRGWLLCVVSRASSHAPTRPSWGFGWVELQKGELRESLDQLAQVAFLRIFYTLNNVFTARCGSDSGQKSHPNHSN